MSADDVAGKESDAGDPPEEDESREEDEPRGRLEGEPSMSFSWQISLLVSQTNPKAVGGTSESPCFRAWVKILRRRRFIRTCA